MIEVPYTKAELESAKQEAYGYNGFVDADGTWDNGPLADKLAAKVLNHWSKSTKQRAAKAIRLEKVMEEVFSNVLGPDRYSEHENPALAEALYDNISTTVWSILRDDPTGMVQQRLDGLNGEHAGAILCRTSVSSRAKNAVYVTNDWGCLEADLDSKYRRQEVNAGKRHGKAADMIARRNPHLAVKAQKAFELGMELARNAGRDEFAAALEAATSKQGETDDE